MLKITISTSIWGGQHPNAGQNIQHTRLFVCMLHDARGVLLPPMTLLFNNIYQTCKIPEQWKVATITPIFKKGSKTCVENYRPIANLCCASKVFEKLILTQIAYLEATNKLDLTGKQQHGFKSNKSTATAGALLQSSMLNPYSYVMRSLALLSERT